MTSLTSSSIRFRFIVSLAANLTKALLGFATGLLVARGLGPEQYGIFAFLMASFTALLQLLDMGSSQAFYTFVSQRQRSRGFIVTYAVWLVSQCLFSIGFILLLTPDHWIEAIWHGESRQRVFIAFIAIFLQRQVWNFVTQLGESQRLTARVQLFNILIALSHLVLVGALFVLDKLSIELVFILLIFEFGCAVVIARFVLPIETSDEQESFTQMFSQYKNYCLPLIPYAWFGVMMSFADTWLLQQYGGAVQQAFYSVGAQFAMVSLIATMSILKILWKEVAEAWERKQLERVHMLFDKTSRVLFFVGACVSGFLTPWTPTIIAITVGEQYASGALAMSIMFMYPVHQSLGQVVGSMYYAMEKTKPYVVLGSIHITLSLIAVYLVLAPTNAWLPGFDLGAVGLSVKMVLVQIFSVNLSIYWLCRMMNWRYNWSYQVIELLSLLALGFTSCYLVQWLVGDAIPQILAIALGGLLYCTVVLIFLLLFPRRLGIENLTPVIRLRKKIGLS